MEIYNETVRDLLSPETEDLRIHEDKRVYIHDYYIYHFFLFFSMDFIEPTIFFHTKS